MYDLVHLHIAQRQALLTQLQIRQTHVLFLIQECKIMVSNLQGKMPVHMGSWPVAKQEEYTALCLEGDKLIKELDEIDESAMILINDIARLMPKEANTEIA